MCKIGNTVVTVINNKYVDIDSCILEIVQQLNNTGLITIASCCGHNVRPGVISLKDGRQLILCKDYKQWVEVNQICNTIYPPISLEHIEAGDCWCSPEIEEYDYGVVYVHRQIH